MDEKHQESDFSTSHNDDDCDTNDSSHPSSSSCVPASVSKKRRLEDSCPVASKAARLEGTSVDSQKERTLTKSSLVSEQELEDLNSLQYSEEDKTVTTLSHVPESLLLQTFSYLSFHDLLHGVALVSKTWNNLTHDPSLWRRLCLRRYTKVTDSVLLKLTSRSENVQYLDISDLRLITSEGVTAVLRHCSQIQTLKMLRYIIFLFVNTMSYDVIHCKIEYM